MNDLYDGTPIEIRMSLGALRALSELVARDEVELAMHTMIVGNQAMRLALADAMLACGRAIVKYGNDVDVHDKDKALDELAKLQAQMDQQRAKFASLEDVDGLDAEDEE